MIESEKTEKAEDSGQQRTSTQKEPELLQQSTTNTLNALPNKGGKKGR